MRLTYSLKFLLENKLTLRACKVNGREGFAESLAFKPAPVRYTDSCAATYLIHWANFRESAIGAFFANVKKESVAVSWKLAWYIAII